MWCVVVAVFLGRIEKGKSIGGFWIREKKREREKEVHVDGKSLCSTSTSTGRGPRDRYSRCRSSALGSPLPWSSSPSLETPSLGLTRPSPQRKEDLRDWFEHRSPSGLAGSLGAVGSTAEKSVKIKRKVVVVVGF